MRVSVAFVIAGCAAQPRAVVSNTAAPSDPDAWSLRCRAALREAEAAFRREAPRIYPPYAALAWKRTEPESDDATRIEIAPGRTWRFSAAASTDDAPAFPLTITSPAWKRLPDWDAAFGRRAGKLTLAILIETERSAVPVGTHPLVVDFVARMRDALDRCPP